MTLFGIPLRKPHSTELTAAAFMATGLWLALLGLAHASGLPLGRFEAGACAGGGLGVLFGSSGGVSAPESGVGSRPEIAGLARIGVGLGAGFALRGELGVVLDPVRFPFRVANVGDVYRPPAASARASLGVEAALW